MTDPDVNTFTLKVPGIEHSIHATSTLHPDTGRMEAKLQIQDVAGEGYVHVVYDPDPETVMETDRLTRQLYPALMLLTNSMLERLITDVQFRMLTDGVEIDENE